jgi:hypothetical protein
MIFLAMLTLTCLMAQSMTASAQQPTPGSATIPNPSECTVQPRTADELRALFQAVAAATPTSSPAASPAAYVPPQGGKPADEATIAAVTATMREIIACVNAGNIPAAFALQTDNKLRGDFVEDIAQGINANDFVQFVTAASPVPASSWMPVPTLSDVRVFPDGSVGAYVTGDEGLGYAIFVKQGDHWFLDSLEDLPSNATPTP